MPVGWAIAVVVLCVAVATLAVILLGVLRQAIPVLEQAAAALSAPSTLMLGPPVGSQLPPLPSVGGKTKEIDDQLSDHHAVLLFLSPGCGPCKLIAEEMNHVDPSSLTGHLLIVTSPDGPQDLGIPAALPILMERDREISDALSVTVTPFAIAVGQDRIIKTARVPQTMKEVVDLITVAA